MFNHDLFFFWAILYLLCLKKCLEDIFLKNVLFLAKYNES